MLTRLKITNRKIWNQVLGKLCDHVSNQNYAQATNQSYTQVKNPVWERVNRLVRGTVWTAVSAQAVDHVLAQIKESL